MYKSMNSIAREYVFETLSRREAVQGRNYFSIPLEKRQQEFVEAGRRRTIAAEFIPHHKARNKLERLVERIKTKYSSLYRSFRQVADCISQFIPSHPDQRRKMVEPTNQPRAQVLPESHMRGKSGKIM
jgi:hypothetical protein